MKEHFCLDCNYIWHSSQHDTECPECGSIDLDIDFSEPPLDDLDGFFEGDMISNPVSTKKYSVDI